MNKFFIVMVGALLAGCAAIPPKPPVPSEHRWEPINRTVPPEFAKGVQQ